MSLPKLRVKTNHSVYLIDQNVGTVTRTAVHEDANDLAPFLNPGEPKPYREVLSGLKAGDRLVITYPNGSWTSSTIVQSVEEEDEA